MFANSGGRFRPRRKIYSVRNPERDIGQVRVVCVWSPSLIRTIHSCVSKTRSISVGSCDEIVPRTLSLTSVLNAILSLHSARSAQHISVQDVVTIYTVPP